MRDAVRCLESAKANDSIAYLRLWFRNPLLDEDVDTDMGGYSGPAFGIPTDPYARASPHIELEGVVSCTSDGLVVILRELELPFPVPLFHLNRYRPILTASSRHPGLASLSMHMAQHLTHMMVFQTQHIQRPSPVSVRRMRFLQWVWQPRQH